MKKSLGIFTTFGILIKAFQIGRNYLFHQINQAMRTLKIYKEHLHALLYSIKKGSINHFFFKLSSFMRKRFREDPYYNQLTKIKKRTSKVTHWSEIEDPKPKLSKVSIALPSQIMNIEEDIDWKSSARSLPIQLHYQDYVQWSKGDGCKKAKNQ